MLKNIGFPRFSLNAQVLRWQKYAMSTSKPEVVELFYALQSGGYRLTKLRQTVIKLLSEQSQPLLLEDLARLLKAGGLHVHRTTLYRELEFLQEKKIIDTTTLHDNKLRYEFADREHHHHAVCLKCEKIEDIELEDDATVLAKLIKNNKNFNITRHALEFFGLCGQCKNI